MFDDLTLSLANVKRAKDMGYEHWNRLLVNLGEIPIKDECLLYSYTVYL